MEKETLDIIHLIERNPITRLNNNINYNNKIVEKLKTNFTSTEQQLFLSSFYCYLNYHKEQDFIIEFSKIWKWLGYGRVEECKRVLTKHFTKDSPTETILLNIKTFKKLCLKSSTKKADEIHDYF